MTAPSTNSTESNLTVNTVKLVMAVMVAGEPDDYPPSVQGELRAKVASEVGVDSRRVLLTVSAGSVRLLIEIIGILAAEAEAVQATLGELLATTQSASAFLSVESRAVVVEAIEAHPQLMAPPASPPHTADDSSSETRGLLDTVTAALSNLLNADPATWGEAELITLGVLVALLLGGCCVCILCLCCCCRMSRAHHEESDHDETDAATSTKRRGHGRNRKPKGGKRDRPSCLQMSRLSAGARSYGKFDEHSFPSSHHPGKERGGSNPDTLTHPNPDTLTHPNPDTPRPLSHHPTTRPHPTPPWTTLDHPGPPWTTLDHPGHSGKRGGVDNWRMRGHTTPHASSEEESTNE